MPQHDMVLDNAAGAAFRADANNALAALVANNSGATAPSTTYAYMWWADTTTGLLKQRNAANSAWITIGTLASIYLGHAATADANLFTGAGNTFQGRLNVASAVGGTVDAITMTFSPAFTALVDKMEFGGRATGANTSTTPTVNVDGLGALTIVKGNGAALVAGDIEGSAHELMFRYNTTSGKAVLLNPKAAAASVVGDASNLIVKNSATNPNYQLDIDADEIVLKTSGGSAYLASSVNLTADITASGANGLDTGAEANSTWYYAWVIYNGTTVASLLSTSSTAPTMPSGYTYKALVGAIYNDGSGNFIRIEQFDKYVAYTSNREILNGALTSGAWTAVSVTGFYPSTTKKIVLAAGHDSAINFGLSSYSDGHGGSYVNLTPTGGGAQSWPGLSTGRHGTQPQVELLYKSSIYYYASGVSNGYILATGWSY